MTKVYCKRLVEGITVPAIIHNMHYFHISMPVFEDGSIDCWERISLRELPRKLEEKWLVTSIPVGEEISIDELGSYTILEAAWTHTPKTYTDYICTCIQQMNEDMTGLFEETKEQKQRWEAHRVSWGTHATPYKLKEKWGYSLLDGDAVNLFYHVENTWVLTTITAYADGSLYWEAIDRFIAMEDIEKLFSTGILSSHITGEFQLSIPNLAHLTVSAVYQTANDDKLKEIGDVLAETAGNKTSLAICRGLYQHYLVYPTEANREALRTAYENVPKHQRMYLGDMDMKDADYRRILYHPDRKRTV